MTWLIWRQHRLQLAIAGALLLAFAVPMYITGRKLADSLNSCRNDGCGGFDLFRGYNSIETIVFLTVLVPLVVGAFWGATVVGKELESGTATLVWTQSVPRSSWVRAKLATLFGSSLLVSAAMTALVTWWANPHNATIESRFTGIEFDIQGVVPVAYTLFGAALGLAAGVVWRRVLPAMATTVGAFIGVRLLVELGVRPHYMAPITRTGTLGADPAIPNGSWERGSDVLLHGQVLNGPVRVQDTCAAASSRAAMSRCMDGLGYRLRTSYQPADRYWTFQWIEFAIFAGLAALLVVGALVVLRRRDS
jgi:hypothetical protein